MHSNDKDFQEWVIAEQPKKPMEGEFREVHTYPKTGDRYILVFTCELDFNKKYVCSVIGVEKKIDPSS